MRFVAQEATMETIVHSVVNLMLWWGVASIAGGMIFSLIRVGSDEIALAQESQR
jgi:hypothetical protein